LPKFHFLKLVGYRCAAAQAVVQPVSAEALACRRGRIDLVVKGSFWLGAAAGALAVPFLLDQRLFAPDIGWPLGFGIGAVLGLGINWAKSSLRNESRRAALVFRRDS
jgi:MFS family permease